MKSINKSKHLVLCNHCPGRQPRPLPHARLMTTEGRPPSAIGRPLLTGDPFHLPFFLPSLHKYRRDLDKPQSWLLCSSSGERRRSGPMDVWRGLWFPGPHCWLPTAHRTKYRVHRGPHTSVSLTPGPQTVPWYPPVGAEEEQHRYEQRHAHTARRPGPAPPGLYIRPRTQP